MDEMEPKVDAANYNSLAPSIKTPWYRRVPELLSKTILILVGVYIFLNPFPHTTTVKEVCFYLSVSIVVWLLVSKKVNFTLRTPLTLPFTLFVGWVIIGLFFALDRANSLHDFRAHLLKYLAIFYILVNFFNSRRRLITLSWIITISGTVFSIGGIYYFYVLQGHPLLTKFTLELSEIPVNLIGVTTVTAMVFALHLFLLNKHLYGKVVSLVCFIPLFCVTFLTQSRGTLVAMIMASVILLFKKKKILIAFVGITLAIAVINPVKDRFIGANPVTDLRLDVNYATLEIFKDFPIMGIGFGMETYGNGKGVHIDEYNKRVPAKYRREPPLNDPHSMLPSVAVRTGLVGLVLFLYILFTFSKMCWDNISRGKDDFIKSWGRCVASAFVVPFVIGIFEPVFSHHPETIFYTILAMAAILWKLNSQSDNQISPVKHS